MSEYLTYEERLEIEACLKESLSFGEIGRKLGKDRTTIAKEIKRHSYEKKTGYSGCTYNACIHRLNCKVKDICGKAKCKRPSAYNCRLCSYCNDICPDFEEQICTALFKPPYVCNACVQYNKYVLYQLNMGRMDYYRLRYFIVIPVHHIRKVLLRSIMNWFEELFQKVVHLMD